MLHVFSEELKIEDSAAVIVNVIVRICNSMILTLVVSRFEELERRSHGGCKDDVKSGRDWPAASSSVVAALPAPMAATAAARDLPLAELQRLYGSSFLPPVSGLGVVPPVLPQAWYQSPDLAAELLQRERLEQLGEWRYTKLVDSTFRTGTVSCGYHDVMSATAFMPFRFLLILMFHMFRR